MGFIKLEITEKKLFLFRKQYHMRLACCISQTNATLPAINFISHPKYAQLLKLGYVIKASSHGLLL
jgi:hypothetical protein